MTEARAEGVAERAHCKSAITHRLEPGSITLGTIYSSSMPSKFTPSIIRSGKDADEARLCALATRAKMVPVMAATLAPDTPLLVRFRS